ncbi:hypothetical protein J3R30DRAFT_3404748 [Lentinula aciculospora]|uniref:RNase H type-1 domain-containing protein n=1 Tax=Lentinula aciculospora TaxID=153920 RepID=A0A9W9AA00_9AGAR|nr:hypothetical protein J3R30DRAFT_3404748 [Lentinula aciculospora]
MNQIKEDEVEYSLFMDGSGIKGMVGGLQLGSDKEHKVFEGESLLVPIERVWHYLMDHFHSLYHQVKWHHPVMELTVGWVPGHEGIEGSEVTDEEAEEVALHGSSPKELLSSMFWRFLPISCLAAKKTFTKELNGAWDQLFKRLLPLVEKEGEVED